MELLKTHIMNKLKKFERGNLTKTFYTSEEIISRGNLRNLWRKFIEETESFEWRN